MIIKENKYKAKLHTMEASWRLRLRTTKGVCLRSSGLRVLVEELHGMSGGCWHTHESMNNLLIKKQAFLYISC